MTTTHNVLDKAAIVSAMISCWSGKKVMEDDDISIGDGGKVPGQKAATKGSKFIVLPETMKGFKSVVTERDTYLNSIGHPFAGSYIVPLTKLDEVLAKLNEFRNEFEGQVGQFCAKYLTYVEECAKQNELEFSSGDAIRKAAPGPAWVQSRFKYDVVHYRMSGTSEAGEKSLVTQVVGLSGEILEDIQAEAIKFLSNKQDQKRWGDKTLEPLKRWKEKLNSLSFLDSRFNNLVALLDQAINAPDNHVSPYNRALAAASVISNPLAREAYLSSGVWDQIYGLQNKPVVHDLLEGQAQQTTPAVTALDMARLFPNMGFEAHVATVAAPTVKPQTVNALELPLESLSFF